MKFRITKKRFKNWMDTPLFCKIQFSSFLGIKGIKESSPCRDSRIICFWKYEDQSQKQNVFQFTVGKNQSQGVSALEDQSQKRSFKTDINLSAHWIYSGEIDHDAYRSKVKIRKKNNTDGWSSFLVILNFTNHPIYPIFSPHMDDSNFWRPLLINIDKPHSMLEVFH